MNTARVPMMFPGQASQFVGMARDLSVDSGAGGRYQGINDALGLDLLGIMENGPAEVLTETR
ncbi:malonyl CoA-acyl carrier protein transacylase, partial [bacterium]|nr:malonyl CoA-acyl carrier protein transacylase [bacterium]